MTEPASSHKRNDHKRTGPRPLPLHIVNATSMWLNGAASLPLFLMDGLDCHPEQQDAADALRHTLKQQDMMDLQKTVMLQAQNRLTEMMSGIKAYQAHPYRRETTDIDCFLKFGSTELLDFGSFKNSPSEDDPVLIAVPSLINPSYILDLLPEHSFMRFMAQNDVHSYLVDWGVPGPLKKHYGLEDYVRDLLVPMIRQVSEHHNRPVHLLGYCMGGNIALAAASLLKQENIIKDLTLVASPWNFSLDQNPQLGHFLEMMTNSKEVYRELGLVPMDIMQLFFFSIDPTLTARKFRKFAHLPTDDFKTRIFVAIEDWANDGPPMALNAAYDCLTDWYKHNLPFKGEWMIGDHLIDPKDISLPCHIVTPVRDRIVPPKSAMALLDVLPNASHYIAPGGHVNMIAGLGAEQNLWPDILNFLK